MTVLGPFIGLAILALYIIATLAIGEFARRRDQRRRPTNDYFGGF